MARLAYTISNQSLTVFVQGRPRSLTKDAPTFDEVCALLVAPGDHDTALILDLVDVRGSLMRKSFGAIQFDANDIVWRGRAISNRWVDRILDHRTRGEDFSALWAALDRLMHNPTQTAIDRLPIFLDRVGLPFMPDGRFLAFKGVTANYESAHASPDGTRFRHLVGDAPRMRREEVDPNPDNTCSRGLHVGAPSYVRGHYSGGSYALVLVAVDPVDVVAVPTDYDGEKMRVCGYEVIEHLSQDYSDEVFGRIRRDYIDPKPAAPRGAELAALACVGDVVTYAGDPGVSPGAYTVTDVDVTDLKGERLEAGDEGWLQDALVTKVTRDGIEVVPVVEIDDVLDVEDDGDDLDEEDDFIDDNTVTFKAGQIVEYIECGATLYGVMLDDTNVRSLNGNRLYPAEIVRELEPGELTAAVVACEGALVRIEGDDHLRDGDYTVEIYSDDEADTQLNEGTRFWRVKVADTVIPVLNSSIKVVNFQGEHLWPRTDIKVDPQPGAGEVESLILQDRDNPNTARAEVGDRVEIAAGGWPPAGIYPVVEVYAAGVIVQTEYDGIVSVLDDAIVSIIRRVAFAS